MFLGSALNTFLDDLGICRSEGAVDRDNLTLCRRDAELITHADSIQKFKASKELKAANEAKLAENRARAAERLLPENIEIQARLLEEGKQKAAAEKLLANVQRKEKKPQRLLKLKNYWLLRKRLKKQGMIVYLLMKKQKKMSKKSK